MIAGQWRQRREWIQEIFKGKEIQTGEKKNKEKIHVYSNVTFAELRNTERACLRRKWMQFAT